MRKRKEKTKSQARNRFTGIKKIMGIGLLFLSVILLLFPEYTDLALQAEARSLRKQFSSYSGTKISSETISKNTSVHHSFSEKDIFQTVSPGEDKRKTRIEAYNMSLRGSDQKEVIAAAKEAGVWEPREVFGTLQIPAINVDLPLFVGTSEEHLAQGAAVLEGTSLPIGGAGTNSVISGHRGWKGGAYFKEIEAVTRGDEIIIVNAWETLIYEVTDMAIIEPDEIEPLLIQPNKDVITVVTCHPYRAPRHLRYVLYAERKQQEEAAFPLEQSRKEDEKTSENWKVQEELLKKYSSSSREIFFETIIRRGTVCLLLFYTTIGIIKNKRRKALGTRRESQV